MAGGGGGGRARRPSRTWTGPRHAQHATPRFGECTQTTTATNAAQTEGQSRRRAGGGWSGPSALRKAKAGAASSASSSMPTPSNKVQTFLEPTKLMAQSLKLPGPRRRWDFVVRSCRAAVRGWAPLHHHRPRPDPTRVVDIKQRNAQTSVSARFDDAPIIRTP